MSYDIVIVGGGPAGLACAKTAADDGMRVLVLERGQIIGKKVCAGGITWNGLIQKIPGFAAEKKFPSQFLYSKFQRVKITAKTPIIATVNRVKLGQYMANIARNAGAEIRTSCLVKSIGKKDITLSSVDGGSIEKVKYKYLVGADGASSLVRRYLGIPIKFAGVGINYQIPGEILKMQWHLNSTFFANGYAWVFPHSDTVSVGAYADVNVLPPVLLKKNFLRWIEKTGFSIKNNLPTAGIVNYDYRGVRFRGNIFLAGDAAGLASGLTGEGIYPAIVSGKAIAKYIVHPENPQPEFSRLILMHKRHKNAVAITGRNRFAASFISELVIFCLRSGFIGFNTIEMAN